MSDETAANPQDADSGGQDAETAAAHLRELPQDFQEAVDEAKRLLSHAPTIAGWDAFGEEHETHMREVQSHAATLASNIRGASGRISGTDQSAEEEFTGERAQAPIVEGIQHLKRNIRVGW
ncbi:hypothetical protein ABZ635_16040 [Nocardiopsis sp. NPDC007018]|uniref:hypothetical protein n=1 Tax=Nocardiopsis sp. NPDC007018 TaxID=3155721 RepID=UPI0033CBB4B6